MMGGGAPQWVINEDSTVPALVALYLRDVLGIRVAEEIPALREIPEEPEQSHPAQDVLAEQWRQLWEMTIDPRGHISEVPLGLVDGFDAILALPVEGAGALRAAITPHAGESVEYAQRMRRRYRRSAHSRHDIAYRGYAGAIAEHERAVGRRAHAFELNVQVLPLSEQGVWWIGQSTIAVTDSLRADAAAFDTAIRPVIQQLA